MVEEFIRAFEQAPLSGDYAKRHLSLFRRKRKLGLQHNIFENHLRNLLVRNLDEKKKG
jgi:hypothetical protein